MSVVAGRASGGGLVCQLVIQKVIFVIFVTFGWRKVLCQLLKSLLRREILVVSFQMGI